MCSMPKSTETNTMPGKPANRSALYCIRPRNVSSSRKPEHTMKINTGASITEKSSSTIGLGLSIWYSKRPMGNAIRIRPISNGNRLSLGGGRNIFLTDTFWRWAIVNTAMNTGMLTIINHEMGLKWASGVERLNILIRGAIAIEVKKSESGFSRLNVE